MEYRRLGRSGLRVSEIALGTMTFGRGADEAEAGRILDAALDAGVNFIDTADTYAEGASEAYLGRLLEGIRHDVVLASKFTNPTGAGPNQSGASRVHIVRALEDSLRRLRTDHVDLYYIHHVDAGTPLEETLRALDDLVRAGKVRYVAASNFEAWRLLEALWTSDTRGWHRFIACQPQYNLLVRDIEDEIVPVCTLKEVGIVAWGPLAGGVLSGKYRAGAEVIAGTRSEDGWGFRERQAFYGDRRDAVVAALVDIGRMLGRQPEEIAIRWLLERPGVASVLAGARSAEQLRANLAAAGWRLPAEAAARLDAASRPPPRYPHAFEARVAERREAAIRFAVRRKAAAGG